MRWTAGLTITLFAVYLFVALRVAAPVGIWQDDGIYLATAQSLADGNGYRHIELPGQPLQTKYPILYPAILAATSFLNDAHPENLWLLLTPTALGAALLVSLSIYYWRRHGDANRTVLVAASVLAALSPVIWSHVRFCMSDLIYGAITMAGIVLLERRETPTDNAKQPSRWSIGIGAGLIGLAILTRGVGITLLGAALVIALYRRRFREFRTILLIGALILIPWHLRQWHAAGINAEIQDAFLYRCELAYTAWFPEHASQTITTAWQNLGRSLFGLAYFQMALPESFSIGAVASLSWRTFLFHLVCYITAATILIGFVGSARRQIRLVHIYAVLYAILVLAWPFDPYRFLIPWTPLLIYWGVSGVSTLGATVIRRFASKRTDRGSSVAVTVAAVLVMTLFVIEDARIVTSTTADFHLREGPVDLTEFDELIDWVRDHTPSNAIIASSQPAGMFLATHRRGHYFWPDHDPYCLSYGADRSYRTLYAAPAASEARFVQREIRDRLIDVYTQNEISHYIEHRGINTLSVAMGEWVRRVPDRFRVVHTTRGGVYTIFAVTPSRR